MRHSKPVRCLIRENGKTGKPENETRLVGTVSNSADAVRLETAPTGPDKSGSKPRGESVYLFLDFAINISDYAQAIASLESFRQKHRYGLYILKIQNHRIVAAEGQPKIFGQL